MLEKFKNEEIEKRALITIIGGSDVTDPDEDEDFEDKVVSVVGVNQSTSKNYKTTKRTSRP